MGEEEDSFAENNGMKFGLTDYFSDGDGWIDANPRSLDWIHGGNHGVDDGQLFALLFFRRIQPQSAMKKELVKKISSIT